MTSYHSKLAALTATAMLTSAAAAAAPVVIDSEQKANAAVVAAQKALRQPMQDHMNMTGYARSIAESALLQLSAGTTPAAVASARNGLAIPCATSGTLTARLSRGFPRVLKLQWQACKFNDIDDYPHERNGNAEILLLSDTFTPATVAGIRFGTVNSDFTDTRHIEDVDQVTDELRSMNLRMLGQVPMTRAFPLYGYFVGEFAFELTGFIGEHFTANFPGGGPPYESEWRMSAELVIASGATTYNTAKTRSVEDLRLHFGKFTYSTAIPAPPGGINSSYSVDGLKIQRVSDYESWTGSQSVDGKIDIQYAPSSGGWNSGCLSGAYALKTSKPLAGSLFANQFNEGELLINGSTSAQFYSAANVPPTLPTPQLGMLIHLDVRNVGAFNYDVPDLSILSQQAQCF